MLKNLFRLLKIVLNYVQDDFKTFSPVFASVALNESFASNFSSNIHTPPDIIAYQIPSFTGFPLPLTDIHP